MIVVGLDVHKHSLTAVVVDELGRTLTARSGPVDVEILDWASTLGADRLWALEDCRHVTRTLERALGAAGERLVRVPPRLTAPQRRRSRTRGKSDTIDALAIARAALQEPGLEGPRPDEEPVGFKNSVRPSDSADLQRDRVNEPHGTQTGARARVGAPRGSLPLPPSLAR
jgi:transposase